MTQTGLLDGRPLEIPADPMIDRWIVALRRRTHAPAAAFLVREGEGQLLRSLDCDSEVAADELQLRAPVVVDERLVGWTAISGEPSEENEQALEDTAAAIATVIQLFSADHETERIRDLLASQNRVHELIARAAPLKEALDELTGGIERYDPSVLPCVVLLDRESTTLHPGSGPSLPPEWLAALDGAVIGPNIGTCGAAAWSGELTVTEDIALDPKWTPIRAPALRLGLRHCWSMPFKSPDGDVLGTLALYGHEPRAPQPEHLALMDVSAKLASIAIERHRTMERLRHDARHDGLTGLANRTAIFEHLDEAIAQARGRRRVGVLFVDLDGLKTLNDTFGHDRADEMIREIGARLAAAMRPSDFVGRFGGDEFVVIAEGVRSKDEAAEIGTRLLEVVSEPLSGGEGIVITASIGIAVLGNASDAREALREADSAMYAAKRSGRDRVRFFEGKQPARAGRHLVLARELGGALARDEMRLVFQPVFDAANAEIVGVEALLRWNSRKFGEVAPAEFIPVCEETGAIVTLGAWVLRESCETIVRINRETGRTLELGVNVSPHQVVRAGFARAVSQTLVHAEMPANLLTLEITESALLRPEPVMVRTMAELEELGVRIVLDDLGTAGSSLAWLRRHPLHAIKIDRSFVSGLPGDVRDEAVVAGVIGISKALGCTVTAEGVETEEQLEALRALGCERIQGFLLARPLAPDQLTELLLGAAVPA
jgi:diguanylate cyclase (GGDEF)-like protein